MKLVTPKEVILVEEEIQRAKNKLIIKIKQNEVEISGTLFPKDESLSLNMEKEKAKSVISFLYKKGKVAFYIDIKNDAETYYYISNDINYMDFMRRIILLFAFREVLKDDKKFEKIADLIIDYLGYIDINFWYSKALLNKKKAIKMFEKMYLS